MHHFAEEHFLQLLTIEYAQKIDDKKLLLANLPYHYNKDSIVSKAQQFSLLKEKFLLQIYFCQ